MSVSHEQAEPRVKLTYDDLILFPDDGNRHEIINGRHVMNVSPVPGHHRVSSALQTELHRHPGPAGHEVLGERRLYEQAGVPNYWIVDPDANSVTALRMSDGLYEQASPVNDSIELQVGAGAITVDLTKIW
jgi:hypothetical protein